MLTRFESPEDVAHAAADRVASLLTRKPEAVFILPAGDTPRPLLRELLARSEAGTLDLSRAHVFQLDEVISWGGDHPGSFHHFLRSELLDRMDREQGRDHLLDGLAENPEREIARHAEALDRLGGADLALLGIGLNGHLGFNEPGSQLGDRARVLALSPETLATLRGYTGGSSVPDHGMTLGMREIMASREICLLATGSSKADILRRMLQETPGPDLPASLLTDHDRTSLLADAEASGLIETTPNATR